MSNLFGTAIIIFSTTVLIILLAGLYFYFKLKRVFRINGINSSFLRQVKNSIKDELEDDNEVKDVFGLESLQLESFKKEFPLIKILEFKEIVNSNVIKYFNSINDGLVLIKECTDSVKSQLDNLIGTNIDKIKLYSDIKIHKTIMERYVKKDYIIVTFQTSLEYQYLIKDKRVKKQERIKSTYLFANLDDIKKVLNCPNCGASIKVGSMDCHYCHTRVSNDGIVYFILSDIKSF